MPNPITIDDPYGLFEPNIFVDPYPTYHLLRHADPVHWCEPIKCWLVTRYADVYAALTDKRFSSSARRTTANGRLPESVRHRMTPIDAFISHWLMNIDAPEHARFRKPLNKLFSNTVVEGLRDRIAMIANRLMDDILTADDCDLIAEFAQPLPVAVIADLVGIPYVDHAKLFEWFARMTVYFEIGPARSVVIEEMTQVIDEMHEYFDSIIERRRSDPRSDLISSLIASENLEDPLIRERIRATLALLLFAGHESTRATIGNGMLALLEHPATMARLRASTQLLEQSIEEMLRYDGPFMRLDRVAITPVDIEGRRIAAGDRVILILGAANRDPARFPIPDAFDIERRDTNHLSFGHGEHFCLGARLARMELRVGFDVLLKRLPRTCVVEPKVVWRQHFNHRGLKSLPLRFR